MIVVRAFWPYKISFPSYIKQANISMVKTNVALD